MQLVRCDLTRLDGDQLTLRVRPERLSIGLLFQAGETLYSEQILLGRGALTDVAAALADAAARLRRLAQAREETP
jgi:hypothetical protein